MVDQYIPDDERDAILDRLLQNPENKVCFDCKSKNPKWASSNIGIFLCYQCTSVHRNFGVHISFVRSLKMDRWKPKEVKCMELGGNKNALAYYDKNGMMQDGKPNHKAPQLSKYKQDLAKKAEQSLGTTITTLSPQVINESKSENLSDQHSSLNNQFGSLTLSDNQLTLNKNNNGLGNLLPKQEEKKAQPIVQKPVNHLVMQSQSGNQLGIFSMGRQNNDDVKSLNAKKLDVNFDNDDFFNSFEPAKQAAPVKHVASSFNEGQNTKFVSKLQEVDDPFELSQSNKNNFSTTTNKSQNFSSQDNQNDGDYEAQQRLKALGNKKGISSEDIFGKQEEKSDEVKQRYQQLQGAKAISSDMFFGKEENKNGLGDEMEGYMVGRSSNLSNNSYDEYKEAAAKIAEKVQENAKILKEKALDWFSTFNQQ